ncbi:MAG: Endoribonuclease YbeY [Desulfovibrio sp.]
MTAELVVRKSAGFAWQTPFSRRELERILRAMRTACAFDDVPLDVTLADDAFISEANAAYLACPGPTNILSFPPYGGLGPGLGTTPGAGIMLLSLDAVNREALLYGQDTAEHTLRLFAHGMAHLTGLDHSPEMEVLEEKILAAGKAACAR